MSDSVDVIKRGLAAFAKRDLETWRDCFDPAVEVREDSSIPDAGSYHGHEGLMVWLGVMEHNWKDFEAHGEAFVESGDDVVTLVRVCGRGKTSQIAIEGRFGNIFTVRDGRVVRWRIFATWADALGHRRGQTL